MSGRGFVPRSGTRTRDLGAFGAAVGKGPRGAEAVRLSQEHCALTVRGTWDDVLPRRDPRWSEAVLWWHDELSGADRHWLANLPRSHDLVVGGRRVRMFRASATSVRTRVRFHHTPEEFDGMFAATELTGSGPAPDVVLYGDIHDAYVEARSRRILANAGSVGNVLDEPTAACLVLEGDLGGPVQEAPWSPFGLQIVRVPYDVEACAVELRTGIHRGLHAEPGLG